MNYSSLVIYINEFKYKNRKGVLQIPNHFTSQPISEPWRTDFLELAAINN